MIELRIAVSDDLADQLEAHFCEDYQEAWMLHAAPGGQAQQLRGYFADSAAAASGYAQLRERFSALPAGFEMLELPDQEWRDAYKQHFHPWSDRGLHWVPIWEKDNYRLPPGDQIVYLDPGMAFGTGNHETTRLCVRRLLDARDAWQGDAAAKAVIDAGCGSGILAISAHKLGFGTVAGFDNDPDAVAISIDNARLCAIPDGAISFQWQGLDEALPSASADLLMANILANVLCDHRELLCAAMRPGGRLILSGILAREVEQVHAAFAPVVARHTGATPPFDSRSDGDWADLCYSW